MSLTDSRKKVPFTTFGPVVQLWRVEARAYDGRAREVEVIDTELTRGTN